jgi:predicted nucleic acid-binding protein
VNVLVDTSVVVRAIRREDLQHAAAVRMLNRLLDDGAVLHSAPQVCYELWVVATRPHAMNGLGLRPVEARRLIDDLRLTFVIKPDPVDLVEGWLALCTAQEVRGKRAHDARLVAWMRSYGIRDMTTFNAADFTAFHDLTLHIPS